VGTSAVIDRRYRRKASVTSHGNIGRGQLQFFALGRLRAIGAIIVIKAESEVRFVLVF
jgi:hypothetical protein